MAGEMFLASIWGKRLLENSASEIREFQLKQLAEGKL
jgi:hypothetical protein